jgi:hypothetical protein
MASKADKRSRQLLGNAAVENFVAIAYGGNWPIAPFAATQHVKSLSEQSGPQSRR